MRNKKIVFGGLAILGIAAIGVVIALGAKSPNINPRNNASQPIASQPTTGLQPPMSDTPSGDKPVTNDMPVAKGSYTDYSVEIFDKGQEANQDKTVLFFAASWCPTCRTLDNDIKSNLQDIPAGVRIVKVDYDSNRELRNKYGIKVQHTLVQVDSQGEKLKAWLGSSSLDKVVGQLI